MADNAAARERLFALRETIARLEGKTSPVSMQAVSTQAGDNHSVSGFEHQQEVMGERNRLPLGIAVLDEAMQGGLPLGGLTEIRNGETRDAGAATGFVLALGALCQAAHSAPGDIPPILWIGQSSASLEAGLPYPPGLRCHGAAIRGLLMAAPRKVQDALWIAEAALASPVFAAIVLEVRGNPQCFGLSESRRLHLRARASKIPLLLLRQAGEEEASSAFFRLNITPAPARPRLLPDGSMLRGSIGNPVFHVTAEKSRTTTPVGILIEWNIHDRRFHPVEPVANALQPGVSTAFSVSGVSTSADGPVGSEPMGRIVAFERAS